MAERKFRNFRRNVRKKVITAKTCESNKEPVTYYAGGWGLQAPGNQVRKVVYADTKIFGPAPCEAYDLAFRIK